MAQICDGNKVVTASTSLKTYTVYCGSHPNANVTLSGYGSVTNGHLYNIPYGTTITATATPYSGYTITNLYFT